MGVSVIKLRVLPSDLDLNFHMNNGVFLSIMDLGRTRFSVRSGLYGLAKKHGWGLGVVGGISITYLKSLIPFQKFTLCTKLAGHYDGWFYIEQRFESRGKLVACALVKVTFLKKSKRVLPKEILENIHDLKEKYTIINTVPLRAFIHKLSEKMKTLVLKYDVLIYIKDCEALEELKIN